MAKKEKYGHKNSSNRQKKIVEMDKMVYSSHNLGPEIFNLYLTVYELHLGNFIENYFWTLIWLIYNLVAMISNHSQSQSELQLHKQIGIMDLWPGPLACEVGSPEFLK